MRGKDLSYFVNADTVFPLAVPKRKFLCLSSFLGPAQGVTGGRDGCPSLSRALVVEVALAGRSSLL